MTEKRTDEETWKAIERAADEDEAERVLALSDAEVDAELDAAGFDVPALAAEGASFVARLFEKRERMSDAADRLRRARAVLASRPPRRAKLARPELLSRIDAARNDPRFSAPAAVMFRNRKTEEATDEELEQLLDTLEALAELVAADAGK